MGGARDGHEGLVVQDGAAVRGVHGVREGREGPPAARGAYAAQDGPDAHDGAAARDAYAVNDGTGERSAHEGPAARDARNEHGRGDRRDQRDRHGDDLDDLSGRGMVNEAPENGTPDELALRRLLQGAVAGLEPSEGALDHLRRAVPARRARKRQAVVGMAAAIVLVGTAVPALVHVASSGGISADQPVNAGHGEQAQGGTGTETGIEGGRQSATPPSGTAEPREGEAEGAGRPTASAEGPDGGDGGSTAPSGSLDARPVCAADQLAVSAVQTGAPDATGKVYGTFRIANVSGRECLVGGDGLVGFEARGAADQSKITVVEHAAGDAASGLPDPSQESSSLLLTPDNAYEVRFAWVPSETCPTTGPDPTPTPTPTPDGGSPSSGGATGSTGTSPDGVSPQLASEGTPADGSVEVTHTADPGGPVATATIPRACAGTIYRTGVLDAS
ncbi:hypothetical protein ABZ135_24775 [Streptomyces sp. NPDC006339]|uniref:hypothetical protein n=1 Tax=Streptomyces sp. NPDC006339 TaxID=3156755 RepID=UPI0033B8F196